MIEKLKKLTNEVKGKQLQRQVYIHNRPKADNKTIYYNVDKVHNAIYLNKQIQFKYTEWNAEGKQQFRYDGRIYKTSPWALTWDDQFYYLIAYDTKHEHICFSTIVTISPQFYGRITGVGGQMQVQKPEWVREEYK